jgi:hypothetical protein
MNSISKSTLIEFINALEPSFITVKLLKPALLDKIKSLLKLNNYNGKKDTYNIRLFIKNIKNKKNEITISEITKDDTKPKIENEDEIRRRQEKLNKMRLEAQKLLHEIKKEEEFIELNNHADEVLKQTLIDAKRYIRQKRKTENEKDSIMINNLDDIIIEEFTDEKNQKAIDNFHNEYNNIELNDNLDDECFMIVLPSQEDKFRARLRKERGNRTRFNEKNNVNFKSENNVSVFKSHEPVYYYFDNKVKSIDDIMNLIDGAYQKEFEAGFNRFEMYSDCGVIVESKIKEKDTYKYDYNALPPNEMNIQKMAHLIINSKQSLNNY